MARHEITDYSATWFYKKHEGRFIFYWAPGGLSNSNWFSGGILVSDPAEYQLMLDMLRNESPLFYDTRGEKLTTELEPVGEGENDGE